MSTSSTINFSLSLRLTACQKAAEDHSEFRREQDPLRPTRFCYCTVLQGCTQLACHEFMNQPCPHSEFRGHKRGGSKQFGSYAHDYGLFSWTAGVAALRMRGPVRSLQALKYSPLPQNGMLGMPLQRSRPRCVSRLSFGIRIECRAESQV